MDGHEINRTFSKRARKQRGHIRLQKGGMFVAVFSIHYEAELHTS